MLLFLLHNVSAVLVRHSIMMTSSNGNIFRSTGPLCGELTGHRWIPLPKASDAEFWCFCLICAWANGWVNNREAGDLRRHRANYGVTVMMYNHSDFAFWWCCVKVTFILHINTYNIRRMMLPFCSVNTQDSQNINCELRLFLSQHIDI